MYFWFGFFGKDLLFYFHGSCWQEIRSSFLPSHTNLQPEMEKSEILVVLFSSAREKAFGDFCVYLLYEFLWFLVTSVAPPVSNAAVWTCQLSCCSGRQSFWYKHARSSHETTVRPTFCCRETYMHWVELLKVVLAGHAGGPVLGMLVDPGHARNRIPVFWCRAFT